MKLLYSKQNLLLLMLVAGTMVVACQSAKPIVDKTDPEVTACKDPRPQMCTKEYRPVCAKRDTGVRCVTTPCPSEEWVTKGNACTACADEKVFGFKLGACAEK